MNHFSVIVVGRGWLAEEIAVELLKTQERVALVRTEVDSETRFRRWLETLTAGDAVLPTAEETNLPYVFEGPAAFISPKALQLPTETLDADRFVLATGAVINSPLKIVPGDGLLVDAWDAPFIVEKAARLLVIGAGPTGVATAQYLALKGHKVSLAFSTSRILPAFDAEISAYFTKRLTEEGVALFPDAEIEAAKKTPSAVRVELKEAGQSKMVEVDCAVNASGLRANIDHLNLKAAEVYVNEKGTVVTNDLMRTSSKRIYAAGLITQGDHSLTKILYEKSLVVTNLTNNFFGLARYDFEPIPLVVPTRPPLGRLGLSEREALERFRKIKQSATQTAPSSHPPFSMGPPRLLKLLTRKKGGVLVGAQIASPGAAEILSYLDLAMRGGLSLYDLTEQQHVPALSESELLHKAILDWEEN